MMIYIPIEIQLRMIREDLEDIKAMLKSSEPSYQDPLWGFKRELNAMEIIFDL